MLKGNVSLLWIQTFVFVDCGFYDCNFDKTKREASNKSSSFLRRKQQAFLIVLSLENVF